MKRTAISAWLSTLTVLTAGMSPDDPRIDLAEFGRVVKFVGDSPETLQVRSIDRGLDGWTAWKGPDGQAMIGLEFDEPRELAEVGIVFRHAIAQRHLIQVQYFQQHWPNEKTGGWAPVDDPFHGRWVTAKARWWAGDRDVHFAFLPYNQEQPGEHAPDYTYRRTYRLRFLLGDRELPPVRYVRAYGPRPYADSQFDLQFEFGSPIHLPLDLSVVNGYFLEGIAREPSIEMPLDDAPATLAVRYAQGDLDTPTRTIVTLRNANTRDRGVSFLPAEAVKYGNIPIPALGVTIVHRRLATDSAPAESAPASLPAASIYDRVTTQPEQTFARARRELPALDIQQANRYLPLGPPEARQEIAVRYDGSTYLERSALKVPADDSARMNWPANRASVVLRVGEPSIDLRAAGKVQQRRLDGYLPIVESTWADGDVAYAETCVATYLNGEPAAPRGDETVVLLSRLAVTNHGAEPRPLTIRLAIEPAEKLTLAAGLVLATGPAKRGQRPYAAPRCRFGIAAPSSAALSIEDETTLLCTTQIGAGATSTVTWGVPYVDPPNEERARLGPLLADYDRVLASETQRWRSLVDRAAVFETPEPLLNDFYKSSLVNLYITADRDPFNGMWILPAGTYSYNTCLNESCIQALSLELRGLHADAQRCLDAMLRGQSTRALHGRFTDAQDALNGLPTETGNYQTFNYNLDHGFALWMLNEHYRYTRDRAWLERIAPALIAACDFITRQCNTPPESNALAREDRYWGVGLLPPGHLEDPPEWLWWFAVNAWAWRGMNATAETLKEIDHSEAGRIARDAAAYGMTLRGSCREAMIRAPVVRLRDGTYVPFQPTRSRLRGRDQGWIRDALYGPIQLIDCGVWPAGSPEAEWILRDAEDNVFIGGERGYELKDFESQWFSWGGMTLQPNLLPVPSVYLARGLRKHALRGFYNALAASVYADAGCFAEWVKYPGTAGGPLFKPPDESGFIMWMRQLLIAERGADLDLLAGAPTDWLTGGREITIRRAATWFGPLDLHTRSDPSTRELTIDLAGPRRNPPQWVRIHAGAPGQVAAVTLDGRPVPTLDAKTGVIELPGKSASGKLVIAY